MRLWMNEPLKAHTTFQIGGPAEELAAPESEEELLALLARAPALVLGAGSNLLVRDAGVAGLTVLLGKDFARIEIEGETIFAQAGARLSHLAQQAMRAGLAGLEFAAGIPGGFAMLGTVPADLMQYYVHAFRIMQKLAYLYGWRELLSDMDEVDDETIGVLAMFFGVMLGVGGAAQSLTTFARSVAMPAFQKQVTKQALTKTSWYPVMKHCLRFIGINLTKKSFAQGVSKVIPVIGGVVSGGMTFVSLQFQSTRLKGHLRELPPPGVDAEVWKQSVSEATPDDQELGVLDSAQQALESTTKAVTSGAKTAATGIADGAMTAASGIADGVKGLFGRRK